MGKEIDDGGMIFSRAIAILHYLLFGEFDSFACQLIAIVAFSSNENRATDRARNHWCQAISALESQRVVFSRSLTFPRLPQVDRPNFHEM